MRRLAALVVVPLALQACERADPPAPLQPPAEVARTGGPLPLPAAAPSLPRPALPAVALGDPEGARLLAARDLAVPVAGVPASALADSWDEPRGGRRHEAIDIAAPHGTPVVAVDDGVIAKLFNSRPGGLTIYQFDPDARLAYYYSHLQGYAPGLREGMRVRRGEVIGYVGSTGNAEPGNPHLHFAVFRLGPERRWWEGEPVNPYPAFVR